MSSHSSPSPGALVAPRAEHVDVDEVRVLPADHLQSGHGLVLDAGEAPVSAVFDPDANALPSSTAKRRRGRPPGQKMRLLAESLRHHHFSFLRASVEGVRDLRWAWDQYLGFEGGPDDERHFHLRLRELVKLVSFAAGERGQADRALVAFSGLDLRPPAARPLPSSAAAQAEPGSAEAAEAAPGPVKAIPSLEEWIEEKCAEWGVDLDYQRHSEWVEQYEEEFGLDQPPPAQAATALMGLPEEGEAPSPALPGADSSVGAAVSGNADQAADGAPVPLGTLAERVDALNVLAFELSKPPTLADTLASWLMPEMARRLGGTAIRGNPMPLLTLGNLIDFVNLFGHRWWTHVPRLGEERSKRVMAWLVPLAEELGRPVKGAAQEPFAQRVRAQKAERAATLTRLGPDAGRRFGVVPLDRLAVPTELDGRVGTFRSKEPNTLGVETDLDAIYAWLRRRSDKKATIQQYGRLLERFYLWCLWVKKKCLGDLVEGDFHDYKAFLRAPPADWVNLMPVGRESPDWRPLRGPQNENSLRQNFTVINAFLSSLHEARYLTAQAAKGVMPGLKLKQLRVNIDRSFDDAQWAWVMSCWEQQHAETLKAADDAEQGLLDLAALPFPESSDEGERQKELERRKLEQRRLEGSLAFRRMRAALERRQRLVLELGSTTGLRLIELVTTRRGAISRVEVDGELVWLAKVVGKGEKEREVVIYDDIKALIDQHHADMDAAGTSFDSKNTRPLRDINNPAAAPLKVPAAPVGSTVNADYAPDRESGLTQVPSPALPAQLDGEPMDERMRPLIGALRRRFNPVTADLKETDASLAGADGDEVLNADRYGSLDPAALRRSLKRFLANCADKAQKVGAGVDAEKLRAGSTHWLRHFFANSAASDGVSPVALMESLGHASLSTTTVYLRQERKRLVSEMSKLRRRS